MIIWTEGYRPFILGGRCSAPLGIDVPTPELGQIYDLGKGFFGYKITAPDGREAIAEATSGAIIGKTVDDARADIEGCDDIDLMQKQIQNALERVQKVEVMTHEKFWKIYEGE